MKQNASAAVHKCRHTSLTVFYLEGQAIYSCKCGGRFYSLPPYPAKKAPN